MCIVQRCYIDHSMQVAARTSNATTSINDKATAKQECSTCLCIYVLFSKRHTITNDQKKHWRRAEENGFAMFQLDTHVL